ncbi:MAG TPA: hypothetical protein DER60_12400 [Syntrophomonas sp.]|jgi:hypothetical protein|nr:hypothetical protein [Syntrophomonas sp.]
MNIMNARERKEFLQKYFIKLEKWREYDLVLLQNGNGEAMAAEAKMEELQVQLAKMRDEYEQWLPVVPLSRCPFSGEAVDYCIDLLGLDGLWWNYDAPVRRTEDLPPTYFALDGAVTLQGSIDAAPFLCKPGAGVPGVLPRLLNQEEIQAVISSFPIGDHQGYAIFYFAEDAPADMVRVNTWGTRLYTFSDQENIVRWGEFDLNINDYDFELGKWIEAGKLHWIKPGDESLTLVSSAEDCPYIGLKGNRELQRIERGEVWSGDSY